MDVTISASSVTGDYKNGFAVSAGTMKGMGIINCYNSSGVISNTVISASSAAITSPISIGTITADIDMIASIKIIYSFTASSNGIFKYQFSNSAANTTFVSRTFKGSILKYKKIN
jgi:hypothetical protein